MPPDQIWLRDATSPGLSGIWFCPRQDGEEGRPCGTVTEADAEAAGADEAFDYRLLHGAGRKGQDALGALLSRSYHKEVRVEEVCFPGFPACPDCAQGSKPGGTDAVSPWRRLRLRGFGVCQGLGSVLSAVTGAEVLCPAYRLAPEHPFPAGLEDSFSAYQFLLEQEGPVVLCGESAGGGMIYALCFLAKEKGLPLPAGLIGISPWTDLTASGSSYRRESGAGPLHDPRAAGPVCQLLHRMPGQPFGLSLVWRFDWVSTQPPVCGRG